MRIITQLHKFRVALIVATFFVSNFTWAQMTGNYTVNGSLPTSTTNFQTIKESIDSLISVGVSGPVVITIAPGTYTEKLSLPAITGTSSSNTITFEGVTNDASQVKVTYGANTSSTSNWVWRLNATNNIHLKWMTMEATSATYARVLFFDGASSDISIKNCEFIGVTGSTANSRALIYNESGTSSLTNNVVIDGNTFTNGSYGIYWRGGSTSAIEKDNQLINNTFNNCRAYGIYFYYGNGLIHNNTITMANAATGTSNGIYCKYGDTLTVTNNHVITGGTSTQYGIYVGNYNGSAASPINVYNNFVVTSANTSGTVYGIYPYYCNHVNVYHNSVNVRSGSLTASRALYLNTSSSGTSGNVDIKNNIFVNSGGHFVVEESSNAVSKSYATLNYNNYYSTSGTPFKSGSTTYPTMADWTTGTTHDANSVWGEPLFVSPTDLHIINAVPNDVGDNTVNITTDIDGDTRPYTGATIVDIGADEFEPPTCIQSSAGQAITLTSTSATITWNSTSGANGWKIEYDTTNFVKGTGTVISVNNDTTTITGLLPETVYDFYVQDSCGATDQSAWAGPYSFKTYCAVQLSGTYTIDSSQATAGTNFNSFLDARNALVACGVSGNTVFQVVSGVYDEKTTIKDYIGSDLYTITFMNHPSNTTPAELTSSSSTSSSNWTLRFNGAENIIIDGLTISNTKTSYSRVIFFDNSNESITVKNCTLNGEVTTSTSNARSVIFNENTVGSSTNNCMIENNTINNGSYGIYFAGSGAADREVGNVISGNTINGFYVYGISYSNQNNGSIHDNFVNQSPTSSTYSSYGIYVNYVSGTSSTPVTIYNNMVTTTEKSTNNYGIYLYSGYYVNIYHNSTNVLGGSNTGGRGFYYGQTTSAGAYGNVNVKNNVFVNSKGGYAMEVVSAVVSNNYATIDYNDYYTVGASPIRYNNTTYASLADHQAANTGTDANSVETDPIFHSPTDLHVYSPVINDVGDNTVGITTDIDGDTRPMTGSTVVDLGADEFDPPVCSQSSGLWASDSAMTDTSAYLGWTTTGPAISWLIEYDTTGFTLGTGDSAVTSTNPFTLTGLMPNETYDFYVQDDCGVDGKSFWSGPYTFTTRCANTLNGTYTIDTSMATGGTNFKSFADAVAALNGCGITGNVVFNVAEGVYSEQVTINSILGASKHNTVTFQNDPSNTSSAELTFAASSSNNYTVRFNGASYVTIDGLTLSATASSYGRVIFFDGSNNNINIINNTLNGVSTTSTSNTRTVVYNESGSSSITSNCTVEGNTITNGSEGIHFNGNSSIPELNNSIKNNTITGFNYRGIYFYYQNNGEVLNNNVEQKTSSSSTGHGIYVRGKTIEVAYNTAILHTSSTSYALYFYLTDGTVTEPSNAYNNILVTSDNTTSTSYGIYAYRNKYSNIYHNSVHLRGGSSTAGRGLYVNFSSTAGTNDYLDVRNNIFVSSGAGVAMEVNAAAAANSTVTINYNNYHATGTNLIRYNDAVYTDLASYVAVNAADSNSVEGDPYFSNDVNLRLTYGTVANNVGDNGTFVTDDIDGETRPYTGSTDVDLGADEYEPICAPFAIPFTEDFEDTTGNVGCWSQQAIVGTKLWSIGTGSTGGSISSAYSGSKNAQFTSSGGGPHSSLLISPIIDASTTTSTYLEFMYGQEEWSPDQNFLNVYYREDFGPWIWVWADSTNRDTWTPAAIVIGSTSGQLQIGFLGTDDYGYGNVIDDVVVSQTPSCFAPTALGVASVTNNTADIFWTTGGATNWNIEYGTAAFTPGSGTMMAATNDTVTLSGLTGNTMYDFYVQDSCGAGDVSAWAGPYTFTTLCDAVAMPYSEGFSAWTPTCWAVDLGTVNWGHYSGSAAEAEFYYNNNETMIMQSPMIDITKDAMLIFDWSHKYDVVYPNDALYILVQETTASTWDTVWSRSGSAFESNDGAGNTAPGSYTTDTVMLNPALTGKMVNIRFHAESGWGPNLYIDSVSVVEVPVCADVTNLMASNITTNGATISWSSEAGKVISIVEYDTTGFTPGMGTVTSTVDTTVNLAGLMPSTTYDVYVHDTCANGLASTPVMISFTTGCTPVDAGADNAVTYCDTASGTLNLNTLLSAGADLGGSWTDADNSGALTGSNVNLSMLSAGSYNYNYIVSAISPCVDDTATMTITIEASPEAGTGSTIAACETETAVDLSTGLTGADTGGTWTDSTGVVVTGGMFDATVWGVGSYDFMYRVGGGMYCADDSVYVTVDVMPQLSAGMDDSTTACVGDTVDLFMALGGTPDAGGMWMDDDATGGLVNGMFYSSVSTAGSYNFSYYVGNMACGYDTATVTVTLNPLPVASFNASMNAFPNLDTVQYGFDGLPSMYTDQWYWDFGDGSPIDSGLATIHNYTANGTYTVTLTAVNNCGWDTATTTIEITTIGMGEFDLPEPKVYPNPSQGVVMVTDINSNLGEFDLQVTNSLGQIVQKRTVQSGTQSLRLDLSEFEDGVYHVRLITQQGIISKPIVIQH